MISIGEIILADRTAVSGTTREHEAGGIVRGKGITTRHGNGFAETRGLAAMTTIQALEFVVGR
jgi:hypothetical protein